MQTEDGLGVRRPRILLVEDMGIQVRLTQMSLERANYDVIAAGDGYTALEQAGQQRPDLILLDIEIPGLNGFQVLDRLRSSMETQNIPVVMLTAHAKDAPLFQEWAQPTDAFLTKPCSPGELLAVVQRIVSTASEPNVEENPTSLSA